MFQFPRPLLGLRSLALISIASLLLAIVGVTSADIATDGSLGPLVELHGPDMTIGAELGQTHGNNLFHSFQRFNIPTDQSATFTGPDNIQNVIGRVTGGQTSNIDGQLRSEVGQANVYLINPAGVVMGPNATVDVPASLHISAANELRFNDGSRFSASDPGSTSTLTLAAPESFGFLGQQPADNIQLNGSQLELLSEQTLSLSAGDIALAGTEQQPASLTAHGGLLQLAAVGNTPTALPLDEPSTLQPVPNDLPLEQQTIGHGQLNLTWAELDTHGDGGGHIRLSADEARLTDTHLDANNTGAAAASGGIDVQVTGSLYLNGSELESDTSGAGHSGLVWIHAGDMQMVDTRITSNSYRATNSDPDQLIGNARGIMIETGDALLMSHGSQLVSGAYSDGDAGPIWLNAGSLQMDGKDGDTSTRIASLVLPDSTGGHANDIHMHIGGQLAIREGASITTSTFGAGNAGDIFISAKDAVVDDAFAPRFTGISTTANQGSTGAAGSLEMRLAGPLELTDGAQLISGTFSDGDAGDIRIFAEAARFTGANTGIGSGTEPGSSGAGGSISLSINGALTMLDGAVIDSSTKNDRNAGSIGIQAGQVQIASQAGIRSDAFPGSIGAAGLIAITVVEQLDILSGGIISSDSYASGDAGNIAIQAGAAHLDDTGLDDQFTGIASRAAASGNAGSIKLEIEDALDIVRGAGINSNTYASGQAGTIRVSAGQLLIDDEALPDQFTGIASYSDGSGDAGRITLDVDRSLEVLNGGKINTNTYDQGAAGDIFLAAGSVLLDNAGSDEQFCGIHSMTFSDSGDGGSVTLRIDGSLQVLRGAKISTNTFSAGRAGNLKITAKSAYLDDHGMEDQITAIASQANAQSTGNAGSVSVIIEDTLEIQRGAAISSSTFASGDAGNVRVIAGRAILDHGEMEEQFTGITSQANDQATGNAGTVFVDIADVLEIKSGATIASGTFGPGNAGDVTVSAGYALIDAGQQEVRFTGISSSAEPESLGDAGTIKVQIDGTLALQNNGEISTSTKSSGNAGDVFIDAHSLLLNNANISSQSLRENSGHPGNISLTATQMSMTDTAQVSIQSQQMTESAMNTDPNRYQLQLAVGQLTMDGSTINAQSTGAIPAASIVINSGETKLTNDSRITTESLAANAGPIQIAGGYLWLKDSQITTSAEGLLGDGGDINLAPKQLILDGGFIQANTAATDARGGDILIGAQALIASYDQVEIGGLERADFIPGNGLNVIQAAAPMGVQGDIAMATPDMDITATLVPLRTLFGNPDAILSDLCQVGNIKEASTLVALGSGGVPASAEDPAGAAMNEERLRHLLEAGE